MRGWKHFSFVGVHRTAERHQAAALLRHDRKDLERVRLLEEKSDWNQNEFVHDDSVKQPRVSRHPPHQQHT